MYMYIRKSKKDMNPSTMTLRSKGLDFNLNDGPIGGIKTINAIDARIGFGTDGEATTIEYDYVSVKHTIRPELLAENNLSVGNINKLITTWSQNLGFAVAVDAAVVQAHIIDSINLAADVYTLFRCQNRSQFVDPTTNVELFRIFNRLEQESDSTYYWSRIFFDGAMRASSNQTLFGDGSNFGDGRISNAEWRRDIVESLKYAYYAPDMDKVLWNLFSKTFINTQNPNATYEFVRRLANNSLVTDLVGSIATLRTSLRNRLAANPTLATILSQLGMECVMDMHDLTRDLAGQTVDFCFDEDLELSVINGFFLDDDIDQTDPEDFTTYSLGEQFRSDFIKDGVISEEITIQKFMLLDMMRVMRVRFNLAYGHDIDGDNFYIIPILFPISYDYNNGDDSDPDQELLSRMTLAINNWSEYVGWDPIFRFLAQMNENAEPNILEIEDFRKLRTRGNVKIDRYLDYRNVNLNKLTYPLFGEMKQLIHKLSQYKHN